MLRIAFVALTIFGLAATAARASDPIGDYDCTSDFAGEGTPAGTLRIEEGKYGFLTEDATVSDWHQFKIGKTGMVKFDTAFAEQIVPGAALVDAKWVEDDYTFTANLTTSDGKAVTVVCPFLP